MKISTMIHCLFGYPIITNRPDQTGVWLNLPLHCSFGFHYWKLKKNGFLLNLTILGGAGYHHNKWARNKFLFWLLAGRTFFVGVNVHYRRLYYNNNFAPSMFKFGLTNYPKRVPNSWGQV